MAMTIRYRPVVILKVVAETPAADHGETTERPKPVPKASSTSVSAQATTAPATMAGQDTPASDDSDDSPGATTTVSIMQSSSDHGAKCAARCSMCRIARSSCAIPFLHGASWAGVTDGGLAARVRRVAADMTLTD